MEGEGPENSVIKVLQRGFTIGDQLVRPARVVVGRGGTGADPGVEHNNPEEEQQSSEG
jgi:hypothetical protein